MTAKISQPATRDEAAAEIASVDKLFATVAQDFPPKDQAAASILLRAYADGLRDMCNLTLDMASGRPA